MSFRNLEKKYREPTQEEIDGLPENRKFITLIKLDEPETVSSIEYCPNGHMNNMNLIGNKTNVCPVTGCEYNE